MALIRTGSAPVSGQPAKETFFDYANGQVKPYTVGTQASTTSMANGAACFINVQGHSSITLPNLSAYNGKLVYGIASDGTSTSLSVSGGTVDCTNYDYIAMLILSGGGLTLSFTVTA